MRYMSSRALCMLQQAELPYIMVMGQHSTTLGCSLGEERREPERAVLDTQLDVKGCLDVPTGSLD